MKQRRATSTSFKPGQSGNPGGRPKGSPNVLPSVREIVNAVMAGHREEITDALRRAATNTRNVLAFVEMAAKLNKELGPAADGGLTPIVLVANDMDPELYRRRAAAAQHNV
jgi:hypothetical protein